MENENTEMNENEISIQDANSLVEESKELLKTLYKVDRNERKIMSQDDLRNDISSFVSSQLRNLENQNTLKGLLEAEIAKRVLTHELSNDELRSFYATISSEKAKNIDSLFKLFVPTQTTPNTIMTSATKDEEKNTVDLSSSQRQAMEKLVRILAVSKDKGDNAE
jgi:hypothetical protein